MKSLNLSSNNDKKIGAFILLFIVSFCSYSQVPVIEWIKCYGGSGGDIYYHSVITHDQNILLQGYSSSYDGDVTGNHGGPGDLWFVKINSVGSLIWQKCLGGSLDEGTGICKESPSGNLLVAGGTRSNDGNVSGNHSINFFDGWAVKSDSSGNVLWQKCYGGTNHEGFTDLCITNDNSLLLAGSTSSTDGDLTGIPNTGLGQDDVWLVNIDSLGIIKWQKCYGGSGSDFVVKILKTNDNGFLVGCNSSSPDGNVSTWYGNYDFWLMKTDSLGAIQWEKSYGGSQEDFLISMVEDSNTFVLAGWSHSNDGMVTGNHNIGINTNSDYWIVKIDSTGNILWKICYGGSENDECHSISKTNDGGYILCGNTKSNDGDVSGIHNPGAGAQDVWVLKIDHNGTIEWQKCLGGSSGDLGYDCLQLQDSTYLVSGYANSSDGDVSNGNYHGNGDGWIIKLSADPLLNPVYSFNKSEIKVYAVNNSRTISIKFTSHLQVIGNLVIQDILGRELIHQKCFIKPGENYIELSAAALSTGIYYIYFYSNNDNIGAKYFVE